MKPVKIISAIGLTWMAIFILNACSKSDTTAAVASPAVQNVTIQSMSYQPATVTVIPGTKITWTNMDVVNHTVTSDDGTSFSSGTISPSGTYSFTPAVTGSFSYHCSIHPTMKGTVQVVIR